MRQSSSGAAVAPPKTCATVLAESATARTSRIDAHAASILTELGEDLARDGLRDTPKRFAAAMRFLTSGYAMRIDELVGAALFPAETDQMVLVHDIEFYSLCEHHLLPFFGRAHVAYLPGNTIIGLSKIPRIVEALARRLQVQERLTEQIGRTLAEVLEPRGVGVAVEATLCMAMRGVQTQHSRTSTVFLLGGLKDDLGLRQDFHAALNRGRERQWAARCEERHTSFTGAWMTQELHAAMLVEPSGRLERQP